MQANNVTEKEDSFKLKSQLLKWYQDLEEHYLPTTAEKTPNNELRKFIITIDYVKDKVIGFDEKYEFKSSESKHILEEIKTLIREAVVMLQECAKSLEVKINIYRTLI